MFFGSGILRGLWVTCKNFLTSYFMPSDKGGIFTVQYPEETIPAFERFRNFPFLVCDGQSPEGLRCTACEICAKECPPKCISITRATSPDGKALKKPAVFDVDLGLCMNCGICEEVCPFDSIFMDHQFEIANRERQETLVYHLSQLAKPNEYFQKIRPGDAAVIDGKRREAEEKKKAAAAQAQKPAPAPDTPKPKLDK